MIWGILKDLETKMIFYEIEYRDSIRTLQDQGRDYVAIFNWDLNHKKFWTDHKCQILFHYIIQIVQIFSACQIKVNPDARCTVNLLFLIIRSKLKKLAQVLISPFLM